MSDHGLPTTRNKVQELQRTLYRAAKADPKRRFHALYDKVHRRDVLERAWEQVRRNRGAAGIDGVTLAEVERYGVERLLDELATELKEGSYRVQPSRRVWIPKPGRSEQRPLSIPSVRDRIVQASLKLVTEPVFEADFLPCSFGFRPKLATYDALQVLIDETWRGRRWVVETDIASCFESIPHDRLMAAVEERICDRRLLKLVRAMLRAGVMESGVVRHSVTGTPQGGVMSPLLANVYLHRLDREWETRGTGVLVRYADDLVVLCRSREEAEQALTLLRDLLGEFGLELKAVKTRIVHLQEGGEGLEFLGFEHRWVRARRHRHVRFLARWPSRRAMQRARDRIRELTVRSRSLLALTRVVEDVNRFLRGWMSYFRYGNSTHAFETLRWYAGHRLVLWWGKKQGWRRRLRASPLPLADTLGLKLIRGVVAPQPNRPWRGGLHAVR